mmetsp:Transcript_47504/g.93684  ORF Transcript_47504/g.93684 Transcript_47504/m.93684 type:complete len:304 (-) Transcript_47504:651-1562(-)
MLQLMRLSLVGEGRNRSGDVLLQAEALESDRGSKAGSEVFLHILQGHSVMGALGPAQAGLHSGEVELEDVSESRGWGIAVCKQTDLSEILLDFCDLGLGSASGSQILQGLSVNGEEPHGSTVFWSHIGNSGTVGKGETLHAGAVELNKLSNNPPLSEHCGAGEHQISCGGVLGKGAGELETDDFGKDHRNRLAEHNGLRLNPAHTPTDDSEAVNHGGMGVCANDRVGIQNALVILHHHTRKVFKVHLMHNTRSWRNDQHVVERSSTPLKECEALFVSVKFDLLVSLQSLWRSRPVDLHRVVDD